MAAVALSPVATADSLDEFRRIVVIYQENHSFDNLYGLWGKVEGKLVDGLGNADDQHTTQVRQDNFTPYTCLLQNDVNFTSPPLPTACIDNTGTAFESNFKNKPFKIDDFIRPTDTTCPAPGVFAANGVKNGEGLPGGCTRDLVHRFYNEQYQINNGRQNRYVTGSDAVGLVMGYYDTKKLPIYEYLHSARAPRYVIADRFFQAAFGGSFLNHQWLIAAATPGFTGALNDGSANDLHSVVDTNGMPTSTPLYTSPLGAAVNDSSLTASCNPPAGRPATPANVVCGDFAVNTTQPFYWPYSPGTADARRLPPLTNPTMAAGRMQLAIPTRRAGPTAMVRHAVIRMPIRPRLSRSARTSCSSITIRRSIILPMTRREQQPARITCAMRQSLSQQRRTASLDR